MGRRVFRWETAIIFQRKPYGHCFFLLFKEKEDKTFPDLQAFVAEW